MSAAGFPGYSCSAELGIKSSTSSCGACMFLLMLMADCVVENTHAVPRNLSLDYLPIN